MLLLSLVPPHPDLHFIKLPLSQFTFQHTSSHKHSYMYLWKLHPSVKIGKAKGNSEHLTLLCAKHNSKSFIYPVTLSSWQYCGIRVGIILIHVHKSWKDLNALPKSHSYSNGARICAEACQSSSPFIEPLMSRLPPQPLFHSAFPFLPLQRHWLM